MCIRDSEKGANILRVHDVKEAVECVKLYQKLTTENEKLLRNSCGFSVVFV